MATSQTQGALSPWGSRGPQNSWKSPEAKCGDGQLLGADVGTLRPHRGCSNTAPLIFPGRQLQPLHSAWFAEAKLLRSDVADLERPFWGSSQTHTHVHAPKHTCLCTHTCTCVCTHGHTCTHKHTCTCTDTCTCAHTRTDAYLGRAERGRPALDGTVAAGYPPSLTDCAASSQTRRCCRCGRFNYVTGGRRGLSGSPAPRGAEAPRFAAGCGE